MAAAPASPPPPDLPPPPPPPWSANPNVVAPEPPPPPPSAPTAGVVQPAQPLMPSVAPAPASPYGSEAWRDHERRMAELELLLHQHQEIERRDHEDHEKWWGWTKNVHVSGYLQPQMLWQWY
ncbi:MAG TPA: hypothetical protein VIF09_18545, partial [Polyangiaceae bacterium]